MHDIFKEDIVNAVNSDFIPWEELIGSSIFVTGATGLIGYSLINVLIEADRKKDLKLSIIALVRDVERAKKRFQPADTIPGRIEYVKGEVETFPGYDGRIDYIIHGASQTASRGFVEQPVETIRTSVDGTENMLELAKGKSVKGFIYLSSMEVYGYPEKGHKVTEDEIGALSPLETRNSYPISKQLCESLCCAYHSECGVPAKIIRLTQTFGPGVNYNDGRIFAYFLRCANKKKDIVLKTKGETERSYLYSSDAATAILTVLLKGKAGEAYNAADEATYCSISEMAEAVAKDYGISVKYELQNEKANGFPKPLYMDLDAGRLRRLGWKPVGGYSIGQMYVRMIGHEAAWA